ncbi:sulfatase-like hydrolase/transferase [Paenibacillus thalictri]|uniref:DUF4976 domain-containing protein n=1 Tax=Paenibacillus thalictri TaxID=2527873 RepID=A0A4Q9DVW6_9BACL|nr:sulfatase-like hydrolase/transferase [Paenibacillus thalictri]TBL79848.1 DUF4976 domain-containing protein [Paenibacillus thalictri]
MSSKPMNVLYIFSDEHNKEMLGCYGHPVVKTPNLDKLADNGVRFTNAYCNSPVCVPSRASLATGRYIHQIGNWDNAAPYIGKDESWGHRLVEQGHKVTTIGKLHYRKTEDETGFPDQRIPMHVYEGLGDIYSLIRDNLEPRKINRGKILEAGFGETSYIRYDRGITEEAKRFLRDEAMQQDKPWVLFLGYVTPHFPLIAPKEYFDQYPLEHVVFPKQYKLDERPKHPVLEAYRRIWATDDEFDEMTIRRAVAAYYGLCTFLDDQIGQVLKTLEETGLCGNTRIIYTSDHGDTLGDHGVWFKSTMYEGAVAVPFIMSGPDLPQGKICDTPISLVDSFPTIVEAVGAKLVKKDEDLPGVDLLPVAKGETDPKRTMFSEYHAMGAITATYMIRKDQYKYIHYCGYSPQLFNLELDPNELNDLADHPEYRHIRGKCEKELRSIVDPEKTDRLARGDQAKMMDEHGGKEAILQEGFKIVYSPVPEQFK